MGSTASKLGHAQKNHSEWSLEGLGSFRIIVGTPWDSWMAVGMYWVFQNYHRNTWKILVWINSGWFLWNDNRDTWMTIGIHWFLQNGHIRETGDLQMTRSHLSRRASQMNQSMHSRGHSVPFVLAPLSKLTYTVRLVKGWIFSGSQSTVGLSDSEHIKCVSCCYNTCGRERGGRHTSYDTKGVRDHVKRYWKISTLKIPMILLKHLAIFTFIVAKGGSFFQTGNSWKYTHRFEAVAAPQTPIPVPPRNVSVPSNPDGWPWQCLLSPPHRCVCGKS